MSQQALDAIPARVRRWIYLVITGILLALLTCKAGYDALGSTSPDWLVVGLGAGNYLAAALGIVAVAYTPKTQANQTVTVLETPLETTDTAGPEETFVDAQTPPYAVDAGEFQPIPVKLEEG